MNNFFFLTLLIIFSSIVCAGQEKVSGIVLSLENRSPIPYTNIYNTIKKTGTYSNEDGKFELIVNQEDSIVFSSIGFKRITLTLKQLKERQNIVYLKPEAVQLKELEITGKRTKTITKEFGYTKSRKKSAITSAVPGVQFAVFIKNNFGHAGQIKTLILGVKAKNKSRIRIRFYEPASNNLIGEEITPKNLIYDLGRYGNSFRIDLESEKIPFFKSGIIASVEILGALDDSGRLIQGTTVQTKFYLTDGDDRERNTWQSYRNGKFYRESFSDYYKNTSNALIGLIAVF